MNKSQGVNFPFFILEAQSTSSVVLWVKYARMWNVRDISCGVAFEILLRKAIVKFCVLIVKQRLAAIIRYIGKLQILQFL
jgi:hypothetical protein